MGISSGSHTLIYRILSHPLYSPFLHLLKLLLQSTIVLLFSNCTTYHQWQHFGFAIHITVSYLFSLHSIHEGALVRSPLKGKFCEKCTKCAYIYIYSIIHTLAALPPDCYWPKAETHLDKLDSTVGSLCLSHLPRSHLLRTALDQSLLLASPHSLLISCHKDQAGIVDQSLSQSAPIYPYYNVLYWKVMKNTPQLGMWVIIHSSEGQIIP